MQHLRIFFILTYIKSETASLRSVSEMLVCANIFLNSLWIYNHFKLCLLSACLEFLRNRYLHLEKKTGFHFTLTGVFVGSLRGHENLNGHNE